MVDDFLESKEFYYAMQGYRHSDERNQRNVWNEYENVKSLIRAKCSAGWQPIDTAPKNSEEILLYCPGNHPLQLMGFFSSDAGGRWEHCSESLYYEEQEIFPTHWMPLPDAPKD